MELPAEGLYIDREGKRYFVEEVTNISKGLFILDFISSGNPLDVNAPVEEIDSDEWTNRVVALGLEKVDENHSSNKSH